MCNERFHDGSHNRSGQSGRPRPRRADDVVIIDGVRTPFCKAGTDLASMAADELGRQAVNALLMRTGVDPDAINEVVFGCVSQPADANNIARVIGLRAGVPDPVPALTVSRNCASGFEAIVQAYLKIKAGRGGLFLVGGTESMSQIPLYLRTETAEKLAAIGRAPRLVEKLQIAASFRPPDLIPTSGVTVGLTDPICGLNMGQTAEVLAREYDISRQDQDSFALRSHQQASAARGRLAEEICPVYVDRLGADPVTCDNGIRNHQTLEALEALKPVFDPVLGTVTAGNASQISDGAAALLIASRACADTLGLEPLGVLEDFALVGCEPERMGLGPVHAIRQLAERGYRLEDADLIEINEAFAAQVLAVLDVLECEQLDRLNVNGGAISLGHPIGATGARLVLTSLMELRRRRQRSALAAVCVGGGQGMALWLTHDPPHDPSEV